MNTYFICATQYSNLGDLIINKMLIDELAKSGNVFIDTCGIPACFKKYILESKSVIDVESEFGFTVKRLSLHNFLKYVKLLRQRKIGLITRSPGPLENLPAKTYFGFSLINLLSKLLGCKVAYIGNCASEITSNKIKYKAEFANYYLVRSKSSVTYLKNCGIKRVAYIPDMAFLLKQYISDIKPRAKAVAIDFRPTFNQMATVKIFSEVLQIFLGKGYKVYLYYQVKGDYECMSQFSQIFNHPNLSFRKKLLWFDELDFLSDKQYIISNRLHSLLVGASYGAIPIALLDYEDSHLTKIVDVFSSAFGPDNPFVIKDSTRQAINNIIENAENIRNNVEYTMNYNQDLVKREISKIMSRTI